MTGLVVRLLLYFLHYSHNKLSSQMQFCLDKEPKCPENGQLLDFISSTAQCSSCNTYIINKLRCITNKVKCITNCPVKCNFVWTKSQNVRKRGNCWTLFQALHSVAPTLPIRSGGTVGITISSTAQCSSYITNKVRWYCRYYNIKHCTV